MKKTTDAEYIVFLEFIDEAKALLKHYRNKIARQDNRFKIITFHPIVKAYLKKEGVDSIDSFHFCDTNSHRRLIIELDNFTINARNSINLEDDNGVKKR